jgi:hypothetical protein
MCFYVLAIRTNREPNWCNICIFTILLENLNSSVGIAVGYWLDAGIRLPGTGKRFFPTPHLPFRIWGPARLLTNGCRRVFTRRWSGRDVKLTTHLYLVPGSRMLEL